MSTKATRKVKDTMEFTLSLVVWSLNPDGIGDGDTVASVNISHELFTEILSRADQQSLAPGKFMEEMVTDGVKYDSATIKRLEAA